jgi:hypothetical protein
MTNEERMNQLEKEVAELKRLTQLIGGGLNQELFDRVWKDYNPNIKPADQKDYELFGLKDKCAKCGLDLSKGLLCYSCPNPDCPCGMGPATC